MATLAIRGHATRGKEIIEILKMLGGHNQSHNFLGRTEYNYYYIGKYSTISCIPKEKINSSFITFTLEEFLEKYPFKVGDKVIVTGRGKFVTIIDMSWRNGREVIYETLFNDDCYECFSSEELQPYKEEVMATANKAVFDANAHCCDITNHLINEETMEEVIKMNPLEMSGARCIIPIPKGYEFAGVDDDNKHQVVFEKIKPQYPKTYGECCKILELSWNEHFGFIKANDCFTDEENKLIESFIKLKRCRDAYWKLAGDWKPNLDKKQRKFALSNVGNKISFEVYVEYNSILCFPTKEMRDAFYENFKDLINECKELL